MVGSTTNLISGATTTTLTLNNVLAANTASYFAILTNVNGSATSSVVSLTVIDPVITIQPASALGLLDGTVQFAVTAAGTSLSYQWYFSDTSGNIVAPVNNGTRGDGSGFSGATSSTLTFTNLQFGRSRPTFVVVVTGASGAVTSSVASLLSVGNTGTLAFWNFNLPIPSPNHASTARAPWFGVRAPLSAQPHCTLRFSGATDPGGWPRFRTGLTVNYLLGHRPPIR